MKSTPCPLCGVHKFPPRDVLWEVLNASYSEECGCSDRGTCLYHQAHWDERPQRPSEEVLTERALAMHRRHVKEYDEQMAKFAEYEQLREEVEALKAQVAELEEPARKWQAYEAGLEDVIRQANERTAKWPCVCHGEPPPCLSCQARKALENK